MTFEVGRCLLRFRRKKSRLSQVELAERSGISRTRISDYETNRKAMGLLSAKILAHHLDCSIEDLYEWIPVRRSKGRPKE